MDDREITDEDLRSIIIRVLEDKKEMMSPTMIKQHRFCSKHLPWNFPVVRISDLLEKSYNKGERVFYRVQRNRMNRFGLIRWRVTEEKSVLLEIIRNLKQAKFAPRDIREMFKEKVGPKKVGYLSGFLRELVEDGDIIHLKRGLYRQKN